ncbi:MAG: pseudouridine-5'-phosphate glycosidase [Armatimonadetes bacterium]|nr:pseudouridine-5'-phosphate glycosidase [Armatimonadota bacterium]
MLKYLDISEEVSIGLRNNKPVVALESTVIAQGLPYPSNVEAALAMESVIRAAGVIPATIAVLNGKLRVGLSADEIEQIAGKQAIRKLGTRDLPLAVAFGWTGATTVSATAYIAAQAGIDVFVTGGIGGVHRNASHTFDVSSDLWELTKTSIIVVCAGAKVILDLPATLEWLETHEIPVVGYQTSEFSAFYSKRSGLPVEEVHTPEEVVEVFLTQRGLGFQNGIIVGVPPPEEAEFDAEQVVNQVLAAAYESGIRGKEVTPWLLAKIAELTNGASVDVNIKLLEANARVGAQIAKTLAASR